MGGVAEQTVGEAGILESQSYAVEAAKLEPFAR